MADRESSELYEFDAPSHVVDLVELENAAGSEDQWFERRSGGADGHLKTPLRRSQPFRTGSTADLPRAVVTPQVQTPAQTQVQPQVQTQQDSAPSTSSSPPSNLVTSWGSASPGRTGARPKATCGPPAQPRRVSKRKEATSAPAPPPSKKHRKSPEARGSGRVLRRKPPLNSRTVAKTRAAAAAAHTQPGSSEAQELERIRTLQQEVALHRKKNEASYKAALAGNPPPKKMVLSATVPKEFHFNTNSRVKAAASHTAHREVDFMTQLRRPSSPAKAARGATVPKPFNLSTGTRRGPEEQAAYVPMAQQIQQYQNRTPDRYHLRSLQSRERGPSPVKGDHLKLTQPHTPNLMTRQRARPPAVKSSAELEAEEVDRLHKFKINAVELNRKILESAESLKRPAVKEPTVPEGFDLQIEKRLHERQNSKKPEGDDKPAAFKAQRLPKKILEGVVGLPDKKVLHPTVPESPAFTLKKRVRPEPKVEEVKPPPPFKAPPVHFGLPFQPQLQENHQVEVCPFSFEERERERRALKEKRLEEKRNEKVPQFKAQPLPDFDSVLLPEKKKLEPTKPEPFRLLLDERGAVRSSRWEQTVKEEQKREEEAAVFKARPNTVTQKEPFQPRKEDRAPLVAEPFELSTQRRAREWQEHERLAGEKEALRMLMEEQQRQEEEQKEKEEVARLRQEQVHTAQPIRHYKPVAVKKSELPLTIPQSPNFSDRFRL